MTEKAFARYVGIGGRHDLMGLCNAARMNGMKIIGAYKPDMHFFNEIALWGTAAQMSKTDRNWRAAHHQVEHKKPKAAMGIKTDVPPEKWVDAPVEGTSHD